MHPTPRATPPVALALSILLAACSAAAAPQAPGAEPTARPVALAPAAPTATPAAAVDSSTATPVAAASPSTPPPAAPPVAAPAAPPVPLASEIVPGTANRASVRMSTIYDVALSLGFNSRAITVDAILTATNTSGGPVDRLELNTIATRLGGMTIRSASVEGQPASPTVHDQTIVLPLGGVLPEGGTVRARLVYRATLRSSLSGSNWMFTRVNGIADLYRWLPWVSKDVPFNRPNHGDPFVTAVSPRVTVKITTDRPLVIATSGERIGVSGLTQTFQATNVRDFTVTAAPDFRTGSRVVGDTTVRVWYRPGFPAVAAVEAAARAVARMEALVGPYPYRHFKVVQSAGGYGMESPGLIWIPTGIGTSNLSYLVHHETAHQWFYGIVGGDQAWEPYTDEAVADFVARYTLSLRRASRCSTARLDRSIYAYSATCYYEVVYIQGGNFLDDLRRRMGNTRFWNGLRGWLAANRFGIASTESLLDALDAATPENLRPRYAPRFPRLY